MESRPAVVMYLPSLSMAERRERESRREEVENVDYRRDRV
jgi:hypothetical protein